jgi:hypothetical protein
MTGNTLAARRAAEACRALYQAPRLPGVAQSSPTGSRGQQRGLRSLGDHFPLVLSDSGQDMNRQLVRVGIIDGRRTSVLVPSAKFYLFPRAGARYPFLSSGI